MGSCIIMSNEPASTVEIFPVHIIHMKIEIKEKLVWFSGKSREMCLTFRVFIISHFHEIYILFTGKWHAILTSIFPVHYGAERQKYEQYKMMNMLWWKFLIT